MAKDKIWTKTMRPHQLLTPGEKIRVMDEGLPIDCRVLSCVATEDGGCRCNVEILEGPKKGEKLCTKLFPEPAPIPEGDRP